MEAVESSDGRSTQRSSQKTVHGQSPATLHAVLGVTGQLLSVFIDLVKTDIRSYTKRDWVKAYRIYFATSYTMIDGFLLSPEISRGRNVAIYKKKVLSQTEELQTLVQTML
ncbi:hypothetical protein DPSP01_002917 [Paraphaeosphaeria sporulosa]